MSEQMILCPKCGGSTDADENSFECYKCQMLWPKGKGWETAWEEKRAEASIAGFPVKTIDQFTGNPPGTFKQFVKDNPDPDMAVMEAKDMDAQLRKAVEADFQQWMIQSMTPDRGYMTPIDNVRKLIQSALQAKDREIETLRKVCGDRYPDARMLEMVQQLRNELNIWKNNPNNEQAIAVSDLTETVTQLRAEIERLNANPAREKPCCLCGRTIWLKEAVCSDERGDFHPMCGAIAIQNQLRAELAKAKETIMKHREGVASFLVPWRHHLTESWLNHFVAECGVEFNSLGYVKAKPFDSQNV